MQHLEIGRRIERLLLLAAPISVACIAFFILAYASNQKSNKSDLMIYVNQLQMAASLLRDNVNLLDKDYRKCLAATDKEAKKALLDSYIQNLRKAVIFSDRKTASDYPGNWATFDLVISKKLTDESTKSPSEIAIDFLDEATSIFTEKRPLFFGIDIAEKSKIMLLGAEISLPTSSYIVILQVLLAPVIFLWLGSLYITRTREIILIRDAKNLISIYPHILNIYPMWKEPELRKKNWTQYYSKYFVYLIFSLLRALCLLIFIAPTVGSYIAANTLLIVENPSILLVFLSVLVGLPAFMMFVIEFIPTQFSKTFAVEINPYR